MNARITRTKSDDSAEQESSVIDSIGERLKMARGSMSRKRLGELVGVHMNTVSKIEKGYPPDTALLLAIARETNVSAAWILLGEPYPMLGFVAPSEDRVSPPLEVKTAPTMSAASTVEKSLQAVELGAYIYVPHFDIQASAGPGTLNDVEHVAAMRPFERRYIRNKLGIAHNELALVNVVGRSMEPILHSGDVALLDRMDRDASVEGIHVIRLDGALLVKSLQRKPGRVLRVSSKNSEYESFDIVPDENDERDFEVIGRLRWAGITLN